jgi:isocitrate dehydrogenase
MLVRATARRLMGRCSSVGRRAMSSQAKIVYTYTDEAPMLATYSLLPIIRKFTEPAGIQVDLADISVAARVISQFPEFLSPEQRVDDALAELGELATTPEANIIKLPNVSASLPQLQACIAELQAKGYGIPDYPEGATTEQEKEIAERYGKVMGSAVNPVLREGNSDRRVAGPVKQYAMKNPHKMGAWSPDSRSHVSHMDGNDFYGSEQSVTMEAEGTIAIEHVALDGSVTVLKESLPVEAGEVIDSAFMSVKALTQFFEKQIAEARTNDLMVSLHLKATMMKVSDPIMFGHCVKAFYKDALSSHAEALEAVGFNANNGIGDAYNKIKGHAAEASVVDALRACENVGRGLAMVDSRKGITNLHVPSDVIIDASMPVVVRDSGKMWNADDALEDVKCMIPDRCYGPFYQVFMEDCKKHGQFDVTTMGNVSNVGLMARKAQEYGSHPTTFEVEAPGTMRVVGSDGKVLMEHCVEQGDIWRAAFTKDEPIKDWVGLGIRRARATGAKAIFWLDAQRAHDAQLLKKLEAYLPTHDTTGLEIEVLAPPAACQESCTRARAGLDTISVTGNVLRDYLTDMFPILELGTSAKMLSIVPMLNGGAMFETGAGGSAPKHVQQVRKYPNHPSNSQYILRVSQLRRSLLRRAIFAGIHWVSTLLWPSL